MTSYALTMGSRLDAVAWSGSARHDGASTAEMPLASLAESELIAAACADRPGAFELIVERYRRPVYQICYRFMGNHEDASDLTQDVFLRAFRGLSQFKGNAALGTWLHRIAVNTCLNRVALKTLPSEPLEAERHIDTASETITERMMRDERAVRVRAAVAKLPKKQRAALVLRTYRELSHRDIARVLG